MSEQAFVVTDAPTIHLVPLVLDRERTLLMAKRQAIIMELGAIEDYLGLERSILPRHKRDDHKKRDTIAT